MSLKIDFNRTYIHGNEYDYIQEALKNGNISGNGFFTKKCQDFFSNRYDFKNNFLTTSCTDALEMSSLLLDIGKGDEIIIPSFTSVSTANAFLISGASIVFCDSKANHPNIDEKKISNLITKKTKAIVAVHYAGIACHMEEIQAIARKHKLYVIEDAAQSINNFHISKNGDIRFLGSIGQIGVLSFHETKNITSGEGGLIIINDNGLTKKAEIIWEKGTNRIDFLKGKVDTYEWFNKGSSYPPSDIIAALLYAQLENIDIIQEKRSYIWQKYYEELKFVEKNGFSLPVVPEYSGNNAHTFYMVCPSKEERTKLMHNLRTKHIHTAFHFQSLHKSPYFCNKYSGDELSNSVKFSDCLIRLPIHLNIKDEELSYIIKSIKKILK